MRLMPPPPPLLLLLLLLLMLILPLAGFLCFRRCRVGGARARSAAAAAAKGAAKAVAQAVSPWALMTQGISMGTALFVFGNVLGLPVQKVHDCFWHNLTSDLAILARRSCTGARLPVRSWSWDWGWCGCYVDGAESRVSRHRHHYHHPQQNQVNSGSNDKKKKITVCRAQDSGQRFVRSFFFLAPTAGDMSRSRTEQPLDHSTAIS